MIKTPRGPGFIPELFTAVIEGRKKQTRRLDRRWLKKKKGDVLHLPEGLVEATIGLASYTRDRSPVSGLMQYPWRWQNDYLPWIHFPADAARYFIRLTEDPRLERLQDISEYDARAEGCPPCIGLSFCGGGCQACPSTDLIGWFSRKWNTIHKPGQRWEDNPEPVVLTFEPCERPEE